MRFGRTRLENLCARQCGVTRRHVRMTRGELRRDAFHQVDRAMLAAGAADRDREIAPVGREELRDAALDETLMSSSSLRHGGIVLEDSARRPHRGPSARAARAPSRDSAASGRRTRNRRRPGMPYLKPKDSNRIDIRGTLPLLDAEAHGLAQALRALARGVDDQVGRLRDRIEQLALEADRLAQAFAAAAQRMLAPRLGNSAAAARRRSR